VYHAVKHAADRARRGDGATFVELLTYRVSAHSSSDDPSRYRDESVTEVWRTRDPIRRMETYLIARGWLAAGEHEAIAQRMETEVRDAIARQEAIPLPALETLFDDVYEHPTPLLREQLAELAAAPRVRAPHQH
jgi:TPP-dependent pyruvate/acetoin dehydrogenase alpha subunit